MKAALFIAALLCASVVSAVNLRVMEEPEQPAEIEGTDLTPEQLKEEQAKLDKEKAEIEKEKAALASLHAPQFESHSPNGPNNFDGPVAPGVVTYEHPIPNAPPPGKRQEEEEVTHNVQIKKNGKKVVVEKDPDAPLSPPDVPEYAKPKGDVEAQGEQTAPMPSEVDEPTKNPTPGYAIADPGKPHYYPEGSPAEEPAEGEEKPDEDEKKDNVHVRDPDVAEGAEEGNEQLHTQNGVAVVKNVPKDNTQEKEVSTNQAAPTEAAH